MSEQKRRMPAGWDPVAAWYDGWMGADGGEHHRRVVLGAVLELVRPTAGEHVLDIGAGQGVLAPHITGCGAEYVGIEVSPRLLALARRRHGRVARFIRGDARHLDQVPGLKAASFDSVVFMLSIQDMNPLADVLASAAWALRPWGRVVLLMTHPCFRVPRQSGWGEDPQRKLRFRRIDGYLTPRKVPIKPYGAGRSGVTITFHRPLGDYVNALSAAGLVVDCLREFTTHEERRGRAERRANAEIPLFLGIRAWKVTPERPAP